MTDPPAAVTEAVDFYDAHYAGAEPVFLEPGVKLVLGASDHPRHCRFCDRDEPIVTFHDEAHALPAAFGNTGLFSNYECDACNHLFGEGIENHLGNWTKPTRTLSRIKGRRGVPTIKKPGPKRGWRVECDGSGFQLSEFEDEPFFDLDEAAKQLRFELHRDTYVPVAALKGLVKIGLTLIPDIEVANFRETYDWIREKDHTRSFVSEFPVFRTFIPGPVRNDLIVLMLMRRREGINNVPYAFFMMAYGNEILQVFLPSIDQDRCIDGSTFSMPAFPSPKSSDAAIYGSPRSKIENLTGRQAINGERVPAVFGFDSVIVTDLRAEADAGQDLSERDVP